MRYHHFNSTWSPNHPRSRFHQSCVEDAVPDKLGFWELLVGRGLSDSTVEKLRNFMCGEIESLGWTGILSFEIMGYDEDEIPWLIQLICESCCPNFRLSGKVGIRSRNEDVTGWGRVHVLTANNSRRMLIYD
jgi:hypothetical protein